MKTFDPIETGIDLSEKECSGLLVTNRLDNKGKLHCSACTVIRSQYGKYEGRCFGVAAAHAVVTDDGNVIDVYEELAYIAILSQSDVDGNWAIRKLTGGDIEDVVICPAYAYGSDAFEADVALIMLTEETSNALRLKKAPKIMTSVEWSRIEQAVLTGKLYGFGRHWSTLTVREFETRKDYLHRRYHKKGWLNRITNETTLPLLGVNAEGRDSGGIVTVNAESGNQKWVGILSDRDREGNAVATTFLHDGVERWMTKYGLAGRESSDVAPDNQPQKAKMPPVKFTVKKYLPPNPKGNWSGCQKNQQKRLIKLREKASEAFGAERPFEQNIQLTLRVSVGTRTKADREHPDKPDDKGSGDLDNFVAGVCDGLRNAPKDLTFRPGEAIVFHDDKDIVKIRATKKYAKRRKSDRYKIEVTGEYKSEVTGE